MEGFILNAIKSCTNSEKKQDSVWYMTLYYLFIHSLPITKESRLGGWVNFFILINCKIKKGMSHDEYFNCTAQSCNLDNSPPRIAK